MRIGYLDCGSGASGDMLLGALLGAGWPEDALREVVENLGVPVQVRVTRSERRGVPALRVELVEQDPPHARPYPRLMETLAASRVPAPVRDGGAAVLRRLAEVESEVHGVPIERVHLHELGGLDTLVDVVGVLAGVDALGLDPIVASPVNIGRGWVKIAHGVVPVPAPATQVLLEGMPVYSGDVEGELLTPTGAALLAAVVTRWGPLPPMRLERIGTGAGKADPPRANVLRLFVGTPLDAPVDGLSAMPSDGRGLPIERLMMLETSIDDMNPQLYPYVSARLFEAGALDVALVPAVMKKGRPGQLVRVLAPPELARALSGILFAETTTLGVRTYEVARYAMERRIVHVETEFGSVPVKVASDGTGIVNMAPEFDACRALAERHGVPLKQVMAAAQRAAAAESVRSAPRQGIS
ncbi:MAG TPA: nickel pincer cofactor biosynthesis protein LarC [bacterium]|nr:nickel pincer cofactor biosynthesis protein LarC [bacterium]